MAIRTFNLARATAFGADLMAPIRSAQHARFGPGFAGLGD
jgi:hypothetical protein